jgi:anti-sigma regulatory factor (Ser/Thr protein kinase)
LNSLDDTPACDAACLRRLREHGWHAEPPPDLGECRFRSRFPSTFMQAERVIDQAVAQVLSLGWLRAPADELLTHCLLEAVANGIDHAHQGRPELTMDLSLWESPAWWHVQVSDQGQGFAPERIPVQVPRDQPRGRGLVIICGWFARVECWSAGRCVVMSQRLER